MKLSNREKVLILILILAALIYLLYTFFPFDSVFKLSELKEEYSNKSEIYNSMSRNIVLKSKFEQRLQELTDEINNVELLSEVKQESIIVFLNNYLEINNIDANDLSFTEAEVVSISNVVKATELKEKSSFESLIENINETKGTAKNELKDNGEVKKDGLTVRKMSVNVSFESSYINLLKFIDDVQNNPIDISITNINTISSDGDIIQGIITLNFYAVPKIEGYIEKNNDWIWKDLAKYGKNNPFLLVGGYTDVSSNNTSKFDFYVSLKPESSDLPTVIVGKAEDENRLTYVYADSNTIENVEFQFKKDNNKYYYKYMTKNSTYPADETWEEFSPVVGNSINLKVFSSKKNSNVDSAGANIAVTNTSGLKIRVDIENDDKMNPRVYFKDARTVIVTRK